MRLLLDIGNSRAKWALARGLSLIETGSIDYRGDAVWVEQLPRRDIDSVWTASVAEASGLAPLHAWAGRVGLPLEQACTSAQACGLTHGYPQPERHGVDRWLACIAGYHRAVGAVLVADAGTALTLDYVSAAGIHRGGLITPGVGLMRRAIRQDTQVRAAERASKPDWLATDTDTAVGLGTLHAALGVVEGARRYLRPDRCLLTGGEAELIASHLDPVWECAPHLVLEGLAHVAVDASEKRGR